MINGLDSGAVTRKDIIGALDNGLTATAKLAVSEGVQVAAARGF